MKERGGRVAGEGGRSTDLNRGVGILYGTHRGLLAHKVVKPCAHFHGQFVCANSLSLVKRHGICQRTKKQPNFRDGFMKFARRSNKGP